MTNTLYQDIKANENCGEVAIYFRDRKIRFNEFVRRVDDMSEKLAALGVKRDATVILLAPNVPETVISFYALNKIGAKVLILHPLIAKNTLAEMIDECDCHFLLILDCRYRDYMEVLKSKADLSIYFLSAYTDLNTIEKFGFKIGYHKYLKWIDKRKYIFKCEKRAEVTESTDPYKVSTLLRSGGTTGKSKIVELSDENISFAGRQSKWILNRDIKGIAMIGVLPLFHGYGLAMGMHAPLMNKAATTLMINYNLNEIVRKINQNRLNVLIAIPYMVEKMLKSKRFRKCELKNLYATYVGADKPNPELFDRFNKLMREKGSDNLLLEGYGLTETVTVNVVNRSVDYRIGSVGKPIREVRIKILDPNDLSVDLGKNRDGVIAISSKGVCIGYFKSDKNPFYRDDKNTKWLITDDIGYIDDDGFLYYKNRSDDVAKIAGYNIFPSDIERCADEVDGVENAAAIYIRDERHPYVVLFVKKKKDIDVTRLKKVLLEHLKDNLIRYSVPEKIVFRDDLPVTQLGKIDKAELKREFSH